MNPQRSGSRRAWVCQSSRSHECRLKEQRRGERPYQGDHEELAHAGRPGMTRSPEASEAGSGRERAEEYPARQTRCQQVRSARAPRHDEVDVECDADPEEQGQGDDVREIERLTDRDAGAHGQEAGQTMGAMVMATSRMRCSAISSNAQMAMNER